MVKWMTDVLTPIFVEKGVSPVDVERYVQMLSGYVYAIAGSLIVLVCMMVGVRFFIRKGKRHIFRWGVGLVWVLFVTVLVNSICFGPMYNNLSSILNYRGKLTEGSIEKSRDIVKEIGREGTVLLKNNGILPLTDTANLNIFGWASTNPIYGGSGAGATDESKATDLLRAFSEEGFTTNENLTQMYREYRGSRPKTAVEGSDLTLPEPTQEYYTDELMTQAKEFSDVAVITIGRPGGEGFDLPSDMHALIHGEYDLKDRVADGNKNYIYTNLTYENNGSYDDFDAGEHYLQLSNTEEAMVQRVCEAFDKVIVIINANNPMELGWVDSYEQIGAVLLVPGAGVNGFSGLAQVIRGTVNPSGRTVDTYTYHLQDNPVYRNIGNFSYENVADLKAEITDADPAYQGNMAFVDYVESIYLGYKYYETAAGEGVFNYEDIVQYPFGYGLSYTHFTQAIEHFQDEGDTVALDVRVTNTGDRAGKDVVQLYSTPPYINGGIEKSAVNLIDFGKTDLLEAGESTVLHFEISKESFASYDARGLKTEQGGYVLEAGQYTISLRADSHRINAQESFRVEEDIDYSESGRSSDKQPAINCFQQYSAGTITYLSRADHFSNRVEALSAPSADRYVMDERTKQNVLDGSAAGYNSADYDRADDTMPVTEAKKKLTLADMRGAAYDDSRWSDLLDQLTVKDMFNMVNLGGFQTVAADSVGKVQTLDSDGAAGLNDWYIGVYGTSFPTAVLIAQTWNKELAQKAGEAVGAEFADCDIFGWYGPSMNLHRNPFCGRNFEYYSEDGTLSGYMATAAANGASENGVYPYLKHFALNEQEMNRCSFLLTYADEQAIRELYLRPFEMAVKQFSGRSLAVMSSFVFIGDVYSGENSQLLNGVLRGEWGFEGMVLTDWNGSYGYQQTDASVRNGNDLMLGFMQHDSNQIKLPASPTLVKAMRQASKNIMFTVVNSGAYDPNNMHAGMSPMVKLFIVCDACIIILSAAIMAIILRRSYRRGKESRISA